VLTKVEAFSQWAEAPTLALDDNGREESDLIQLQGITGLDPVNATVTTSAYGSIDGAVYTGGTVGTRNIVLTLKPNPDWVNWTVASLRRLIYTYFMPKQAVNLRFQSDDIPTVAISGIVESCSANPFAQEVLITVSIICPNPYFQAINPTIFSGTTGAAATRIQYNGTVETGMNVKLRNIPGETPSYLHVVNYDLNTEFDVNVTLNDNIYCEVNSVPGSKYAQLVNTANGTVQNVLGQVVNVSWNTWALLQPGNNSIAIGAGDANKSWNLNWEISFYELYGGL